MAKSKLIIELDCIDLHHRQIIVTTCSNMWQPSVSRFLLFIQMFRWIASTQFYPKNPFVVGGWSEGDPCELSLRQLRGERISQLVVDSVNDRKLT